jgi:hypothetical protein
VERAVGRGRVLVWASTLDSYWGDLPLQPVYVPLVHGMATRASGYAESRPWHVAGETVDLARLAGEAAEQWTGRFNPRAFDARAALSLYERAY